MPNSYIAIVVSLMLLAGLGLFIARARKMSRERKQWEAVPAAPKRARS